VSSSLSFRTTTGSRRVPTWVAPGSAATTRAAQAAAALALLADLMPPLAGEGQVAAPGRNPLIELNERAQVGAITDLGFTVTAVGPPHDPVFTCSAACRHADGEISGTGQERTKSQARAAAAEALLAELAGPAEPAPPSHVQAVSRYATSPAGVADRLIQAGCAIGYAKGRFHLGLLDGWPLTRGPGSQHTSNTSPGPEGVQHSDNTERRTRLRGRAGRPTRPT